MVGDRREVGGVGWRPNGSQCRKWLVATQTAPESTVITGLIPVFYLHRQNTRPLAAGQGQPLPPTNDYAKLFLQGKKKYNCSRHEGKL